MISCEKVLEAIYEYLDREMSEDGIQDVRKHLDLCRSCFSRVDFERLLREHMQTKTFKPCPDKVKKRIEDLLKEF